jgi:hypothetical protein
MLEDVGQLRKAEDVTTYNEFGKVADYAFLLNAVNLAENQNQGHCLQIYECQLKAKPSTFPLSSHLVIPFQRFFKYHLLPKEIHRPLSSTCINDSNSSASLTAFCPPLGISRLGTQVSRTEYLSGRVRRPLSLATFAHPGQAGIQRARTVASSLHNVVMAEELLTI